MHSVYLKCNAKIMHNYTYPHCRYYASPRTLIQKTQNVALVFRFLTEVERLHLGDISKGVIVIIHVQYVVLCIDYEVSMVF